MKYLEKKLPLKKKNLILKSSLEIWGISVRVYTVIFLHS